MYKQSMRVFSIEKKKFTVIRDERKFVSFQELVDGHGDAVNPLESGGRNASALANTCFSLSLSCVIIQRPLGVSLSRTV